MQQLDGGFLPCCMQGKAVLLLLLLLLLPLLLSLLLLVVQQCFARGFKAVDKGESRPLTAINASITGRPPLSCLDPLGGHWL